MPGREGAAPGAGQARRRPHQTRLAIDPACAPVVARIFAWRVDDRLGLPTITARLNADHGACPPPKGGTWTEMGVYALLANPKYTGHMVWNRTAKTGGRRRLNPPSSGSGPPSPPIRPSSAALPTTPRR